MKLRRLRLDGFGALRGEFIFSSDRCNLLLAANEAGKSTLAEAVIAALYGIPRQRAGRDSAITTKELRRPWSGGPYGLELELDHEGRALIVRRDFERETTSVHEGLTGRDVTEEFASGKEIDVGEPLTGLPRAEFIKCCLAGRQEVSTALKDATGLTVALQKAASSQRGEVASGEALEVLRKAVGREYAGTRLIKGKVETEIARLEEDMAALRSELEALAARRHKAEARILKLEEATRQEGLAEQESARIEHLHLLSAREEARRSLAEVTLRQDELEAHLSEAVGLAAYARFPSGMARQVREAKGRLDTLRSRRQTLGARLGPDLEAPLAAARGACASYGAMDRAFSDDPALPVRTAERLAVLSDLWRLRREKIRSLRREERALRASGADPDRVTQLAATFAGLNETARRFLSTYRERAAELKAALFETERRRDQITSAEGSEDPALISLARARRVETAALVVGAIGIATAPILWFTLQNKLPAMLMSLVSAASFLWWMRLLERRPAPGLQPFGSKVQQVRTEIWETEREAAALTERLSSIAAELKHPHPENLLDEYRELEGLQERAAPLAAIAASLAETKMLYDVVAAELMEMMHRAGAPPDWRVVTPRAARRFRERVDRCAEARGRAALLEGRLDEGRREMQALDAEITTGESTLRASLLGALPEAARDPSSSLDELLVRFEQAAALHERLDLLENELIPAARRRQGDSPAGQAARLHKEIDLLGRHIEAAIEQLPELGDLTPEKDRSEYMEERRRLSERVRDSRQERLALSEELGDLLKEYRRDLPDKQAMLESRETAHRRAVSFRDAVGLAIEALERIARASYAEWAEILNEKTGEILGRLNPSWGDVRFDTDLSFTVRDAATGERRAQAQVDSAFSTGARDQIYLAVRLGIAEYLSGSGARLPLILDDPFASFDDARFDGAMRFLLETLSRRHQILVLSCHARRHEEWLGGKGAPLTDRVRLVDLAALTA